MGRKVRRTRIACHRTIVPDALQDRPTTSGSWSVVVATWVWGRPLARPPSVWLGGAGGRPVVGARRCPTLPHPGGCSTIGAGSLSFRVRNGAGRWLSRCDHRDVYGVVCACCVPPGARACVRVCGGGGLVLRTAWWTRAFLGVCVVVCCLCRPISTGRLAGPCGSSTSGLSTQWSAGGLPPLLGGVDTLS